MIIDAANTIVLSAEENQDLMDQLKILRNEYEDPPIELEYVSAMATADYYQGHKY